mmetsp:Transcript_5328/g.11835  ORF Transcript_5328/g.11835 Transcript_5328/m.11835 type:complete len:247 (-) Transcript_5328:192-932(-)
MLLANLLKFFLVLLAIRLSRLQLSVQLVLLLLQIIASLSLVVVDFLLLEGLIAQTLLLVFNLLVALVLLFDLLARLDNRLLISLQLDMQILDLSEMLIQILPEILQLLVQLLLHRGLVLHIGLRLGQRPLEAVELGLALILLSFQGGNLLEELCVVLGQLLNLPLEHILMLHQIVLLLDQIVHSVLLIDTQPRALLHQAAQIGNLHLQIMNSVFGSLFLLVGRLHHLPGPLNLLFQSCNCRLILLG